MLKGVVHVHAHPRTQVLYMPKGVVHYALTMNSTESFHITIGLHRDNMQWLDVLHHMMTSEEEDSGEGGDARGDSRVPLELMQVYAETAEGVRSHRPRLYALPTLPY